MSTDHPIDLARSLRPQTFIKVAPDRIADPIVEPVWGGIRLIAAAHPAAAHPAGAALFDQGDELQNQPHLAQALATAVAETTTHGAILDGYLTKQVATEQDPVNLVDPDPLPSTGKLVAQSMFLGLRRDRAAELARRVEREREERTFAPDEAVNLVVVDLLWLDGEWLLDVPLAERKRLLDAILSVSDLVRPGTYVRPPLHGWIGTWRSQGFAGLTFKAANSRYRPGKPATDWTTAPMPRR